MSISGNTAGLGPFEPEETEGSITERFERVVERAGSALAMRTEDASLTLAELGLHSRAVAAAVAARTSAGTSVAILTSDYGRLFASMFGSLRAGCFHVIVDPFHPEARIRAVLEDCEASLVLTDAQSASRVRAIAGRDLPVVDVDELDLTVAPDRSFPERSADDLACLTYTSGSTGRPKAIMQPHRNLLRRARQWGVAGVLTMSDRFALLYPPGFSAGTGQIYGSILNAVPLYPFDIRARAFSSLAEFINRERITRLNFVTSVFRQMMLSLDPEVRFPSVRAVTLGAEAVTTGDIELFRGRFNEDARFTINYASTEAAMTSHYRIDLSKPHTDPVPVGKTIHGVEVRIVDEEGREVPTGAEGEIIVIGDLITDGYWKNPELQAERYGMNDDGRRLFRTGDLGRITPNGDLVMLGRLDRQLKIRGNRVEPGEIETVLSSHPSVRGVAVTGRSTGDGGVTLVAFVVPLERDLEPAALRDWLGTRLAPHMVPSRFVMLESLPVNANGKLDRRALDEIDIGPTTRQRAEPRDETERRLAAIWSRVLGGIDVGRDANFFDIGGDSLLAARVLAEIEKEFSFSLPLAAILSEPTLAGQARQIREAASGSFDVLVPLRPEGSRPPLFLIAAMGGNVLSYRDLVEALGDDQPVWGLQAHGLDGSTDVPKTIEAIAERYVSTIRAFQPDGPYYLGGHSIGGAIAYEMAQQLRAAGAEVGLAIMLDTRAEGRRASLLKRGFVRLQLIAKNPIRRIRGFTREYIRRARRWADMRRIMTATATDETIPDAIRVAAAIRTAALAKYRFAPYEGSIFLIRSEWGMRTVVADDDLGWSSFARGGVEIHDVAGDHFDFLIGPRAGAVAAAIRDAMNRQTAEKGIA